MSNQEVTNRQQTVARSGEVGRIREPQSPMPPQHQEKPGIESKLTPRPKYEAPLYKGADKLKEAY